MLKAEGKGLMPETLETGIALELKSPSSYQDTSVAFFV